MLRYININTHRRWTSQTFPRSWPTPSTHRSSRCRRRSVPCASTTRCVAAARAASNGIPEDVIQPLRRANSIDVVHNVPKHAKCQITKQYIKHGITLHLQPNDSLITVAPNYRERLRNLFLIFHFDDEIRSAFNDWVKRCGTSDIQPFLEYNSSSYVKKLYVVFQGLCNT